MTTTGQYQGHKSALALGVMFMTAVIATPAQGQTYTVLHRFKGTDGANPISLIGDSAGNLYGATLLGGEFGLGVVFKLDKTGETVLYSFTGGADGSEPIDLIRDSAGNLYGATEFGGVSSQGVVFKLDTTGTETVLYTFTGRADGGAPTSGLIRDSAGNLYGTTFYGGDLQGSCRILDGCGVVFKVDATGTETVLHRFKGSPTDGGPPPQV